MKMYFTKIKAALEALGLRGGGQAEIGAKIGEDGIRRAAVYVAPGISDSWGRSHYSLLIDWPLLEELVEEEHDAECREYA